MPDSRPGGSYGDGDWDPIEANVSSVQPASIRYSADASRWLAFGADEEPPQNVGRTIGQVRENLGTFDLPWRFDPPIELTAHLFPHAKSWQVRIPGAGHASAQIPRASLAYPAALAAVAAETGLPRLKLTVHRCERVRTAPLGSGLLCEIRDDDPLTSDPLCTEDGRYFTDSTDLHHFRRYEGHGQLVRGESRYWDAIRYGYDLNRWTPSKPFEGLSVIPQAARLNTVLGRLLYARRFAAAEQAWRLGTPAG